MWRRCAYSYWAVRLGAACCIISALSPAPHRSATRAMRSFKSPPPPLAQTNTSACTQKTGKAIDAEHTVLAYCERLLALQFAHPDSVHCFCIVRYPVKSNIVAHVSRTATVCTAQARIASYLSCDQQTYSPGGITDTQCSNLAALSSYSMGNSFPACFARTRPKHQLTFAPTTLC